MLRSEEKDGINSTVNPTLAVTVLTADGNLTSVVIPIKTLSAIADPIKYELGRL